MLVEGMMLIRHAHAVHPITVPDEPPDLRIEHAGALAIACPDR
jgi:hypothetical protein